MTLTAKPVVDKQFWILQDGTEKVGNIQATNGGYQVKINNQVATFKTMRMAAQRVDIVFAPKTSTAQSQTTGQVHGYPAQGRVYNGIWNVPRGLPLYTRTSKSKSWYAAGWYRVQQGRGWQIVQCPKLILLQRYPYQGPFYTQEQAREHTHQ